MCLSKLILGYLSQTTGYVKDLLFHESKAQLQKPVNPTPSALTHKYLSNTVYKSEEMKLMKEFKGRQDIFTSGLRKVIIYS